MANKQVVVDETKPVEDQPSNVSVVLDANGQPIKSQKETPEPKYVTVDQLSQTIEQALKKATAPLYYEIRNRDKQTQYQQPIQQTPKPEPTEWDAKLQKDWKGTVEELAEARVNHILQQREAAQAAAYERQRSAQLLEDNKRKVLERHKELNDETSQKADIYRQVLTEHPEYLSNPFGPVLAMRDMEDKMKDSGYVDDSTKQIVQKEVARQTRTVATSVPTGSSPQPNRRITLTKEQKELCDAKGIKYENYAKYAQQAVNKGGVEA